jgi:hypothetical protein
MIHRRVRWRASNRVRAAVSSLLCCAIFRHKATRAWGLPTVPNARHHPRDPTGRGGVGPPHGWPVMWRSGESGVSLVKKWTNTGRVYSCFISLAAYSVVLGGGDSAAPFCKRPFYTGISERNRNRLWRPIVQQVQGLVLTGFLLFSPSVLPDAFDLDDSSSPPMADRADIAVEPFADADGHQGIAGEAFIPQHAVTPHDAPLDGHPDRHAIAASIRTRVTFLLVRPSIPSTHSLRASTQPGPEPARRAR